MLQDPEDPSRSIRPPAPLHHVRAAIDGIDREIVRLLAQRWSRALEAARLKSPGALQDPGREAEVLAHVTALARQSGLDPALVEALYRDLIAGCLRAEIAACEGDRPPVACREVAVLGSLPAPEELRRRQPLSPAAAATVLRGRRQVEAVLDGADPRLVLVVGPCSVHDTEAGLEYARRLRALADEVAGALLVVMRVYLEKPRSSVGWDGFTNDPRLDGSFQIGEGLEHGRRFLVDVNALGLPVAAEALDPMAPQYQGDLVSWYAIGARTAESQIHRKLASGLSCPVGVKNGTDGRVDAAINAIVAMSRPQAFIGLDDQGRSAAMRSQGNRHGHLVLRGGAGRPNFDRASVSSAQAALARAGLQQRIVVDCSHANSGKDPALQPTVARAVAEQVREGSRSIVGLMLESFLEGGNQPIPADPSRLRYGCSVTDACLGWEETVATVRALHRSLAPVVAARRRQGGGIH